MNLAAIGHLRVADPVLAAVIDRVGPCTLRPRRSRSPFEALVRAVANQQLNGKAADTILRRFCALVPRRRFPSPGDVLELDPAEIRAVGFSGAKVAAIRDIASRTVNGEVPTGRTIATLDDDAIIARLTECRGVGKWTVQMLLIFKLGRPDVLPADDFGVQQGFRVAFGLGQAPRPKAILEHGERWRPHRSTAAWYLWRAWDLANKG